ncbi:MAG: succinate dehydrogenase cytochrome b558 subunit [Pirellulaceae bacterium]|nr:succinate dehydrogenase cytochrome b558 subunit [Planctomycetales bacterium]MCA9219847.1 succinate dehydrogenase cytochrome b558 subunit [Planctomycetales bacterium]
MGHESRPVVTSPEVTAPSFLARHDFLFRRLHSLSGLIPVGAYMVVHLLTNASVLEGAATYQKAVYQIHSLGSVLWIVEWVFIFLPLIFHAVMGVVYVKGALPNNSSYRYTNNYRYTLQRASGMIAFLFIFAHVFHMHGWFHVEAWERNISEPLGGAQFRPYNAASSLGLAMQNFAWQAFYLIGVLSCVFHLANGIWTMGITWGVWITPEAQRRANWVALVFGIGLTAVSLGSFVGAVTVDVPQAKQTEDQMYEAKLESGELKPNDHKRFTEEEAKRVAEIASESGGVAQGETESDE